MALNRELHPADGEMLLVDKPKGWTSFDVVKEIRHAFRVRKVGHAGTLDPMATGLLIVCTGKKTRDIDTFVGLEKEYEAEMTLGATTESFDADTPVIDSRGTAGISAAQIRDVISRFVGPQLQVPPMWSAAKVRGRRLYSYARKGQVVERKAREIVVRSLDVKHVEIPVVRFTVVCSKGTYVRALVHDIGEQLGCGAFLSALRRTRIGDYRLSEAMTMDELLSHTNVAGRAAVC